MFSLSLRVTRTVKREDIKFIKMLGEGATGCVYKATLKDVPVAAKKLKDYGKDVDKRAYRDLIMEIDVLCAVGKHPNLVAFCGACIDDQEHPIILEELMTGPNIDEFFQSFRSWVSISVVFACVCLKDNYLYKLCKRAEK